MFFWFDSQQPSEPNHLIVATEGNMRVLLGDLVSVLSLDPANQSSPLRENLSCFITNMWIPRMNWKTLSNSEGILRELCSCLWSVSISFLSSLSLGGDICRKLRSRVIAIMVLWASWDGQWFHFMSPLGYSSPSTWSRGLGWASECWFTWECWFPVTALGRAAAVLPGMGVAAPVICSSGSQIWFRSRCISSRITFQNSSGRQCDEG